MANDVAAMRDKVFADMADKHAVLESLQAEARAITEANEARAALIERIKAVKLEIARVADEYGELARAAALVAGGKNYLPPR